MDFNYRKYCMDILIKKTKKLNLELSFKDEYFTDFIDFTDFTDFSDFN